MSQLVFPKRGTRHRENGLTYRSKCRRYALYQSDQVAGVRLRPIYWKAMLIDSNGFPTTILSRHKSRAAALAACQRHANKQGVK